MQAQRRGQGSFDALLAVIHLGDLRLDGTRQSGDPDY
jgi:hypothetical protein